MTTDRNLRGRAWWLASALVLAGSLAATVPTAGDLGLTWDEPAYRFSQNRSAEWWHRLGNARSRADLEALLEPDALLFYWPYARHGINFHPPLAGQLSLLTHAAFGRWVKDIPARRLASVIEFSITVTLVFGFLARRYGAAVGLTAAGALLFMPRVYGDAHLATTDWPGPLLWASTAFAFWKGLHEDDARRWRVLVGILLGLAFVEKMGAILAVVPILLWLGVARLPRSFHRDRWKEDWTDGVLTTSALLLPLIVAFAEILRIRLVLPPPGYTNLFVEHPQTSIPGAILAVPLAVWLIRRLIGRLARGSMVWGIERPGLETFHAILAFGPLVGWLGNPAWWRETIPRLAHYYMLNTDRKGSLNPIRIYYLGSTYEFSLPWHNGWVLIAVTVPAAILLAALPGLLYGFKVVRKDRLPLFFLLNLLVLPSFRMLETPAHDGVRLMLPTFVFLAGFAGWGAGWVADGLSRVIGWGAEWVADGLSRVITALMRRRPHDRNPNPAGSAVRTDEPSPQAVGTADPTQQPDLDLLDWPPMGRDIGWTFYATGRDIGWTFYTPSGTSIDRVARAVMTLLVLVPSAWQLVKVHPYELSYYNEFIGGPRGAWKAGFELTYWYDAFNPEVLDDLNARLPTGAGVDFFNENAVVSTFLEVQSLGQIRPDLSVMGARRADQTPYIWLLTHDSKATQLTRLMFAMRPWYEKRPRQLDGRRVLAVAVPVTPSRAYALKLMVDGPDEQPRVRPRAPEWVHRYAPFLGRLWGEGVTVADRPGFNRPLLDWAKRDPRGFLNAAKGLAARQNGVENGRTPDELRLLQALNRFLPPAGVFGPTPVRTRPESIVDAARIVVERPEALLKVLTHERYTDPDEIGGPLDQGLPPPAPVSGSR